MTDSWGFLLQTLTASEAALLLLLVKAMFRDKLSPRWQFGIWSILGLVLLIPAGLGGRYSLLNWPLWLEALKSQLTGDYMSITRVWASLPLPSAQTAGDWLFWLYLAGVLFLLGRYALAYIRLRRALQQEQPEELPQVRQVAERYGLPCCLAVQVPGLPSAFICGVRRPVLVLPAGAAVDDKVILHELLHLKYHDAAWGLLICLLRCLHWCNPLLWYCANRASNDLEALCDQRALERLAGEERRDYGRILLEMATDNYARVPGTSAMANGERNIRRRIEAIASFKKYSAGLKLPALCIGLALAVPLLFGVQTQAMMSDEALSFRRAYGEWGKQLMIANSRLKGCGTYAGAFDTYAKSLLVSTPKNYYYRALCAPLEEQEHWLSPMMNAGGDWSASEFGLPAWPNPDYGYLVYNLRQQGEAYEGLLVLELSGALEGREPAPYGHCLLAVQRVRVEQQAGRWVALPQEDFQVVESRWASLMNTPDDVLPPFCTYAAEYGDFRLEMKQWYSYLVTSWSQPGENVYIGGYTWGTFNTFPQPDGAFDKNLSKNLYAVYIGDEADKEKYNYLHIGAVSKPWVAGAARPYFQHYSGLGDVSGSSNQGECFGFRQLGADWNNPVFICGSGGYGVDEQPDRYAADFYLNGSKAAELELAPVTEGGGDDA